MKFSPMLRRTLLAGAGLAALVLAGCAHQVNQAQPDPLNPKVLVYDGRVAVDLDPLYFNRKAGKVTITWRLPAGGPYTFADNGIFLEPADRDTTPAMVAKEFQCQRVEPTAYTCVNQNTRKANYKYTVRVMEGSKALVPLDPVIINTWD